MQVSVAFEQHLKCITMVTWYLLPDVTGLVLTIFHLADSYNKVDSHLFLERRTDIQNSVWSLRRVWADFIRHNWSVSVTVFERYTSKLWRFIRKRCGLTCRSRPCRQTRKVKCKGYFTCDRQSGAHGTQKLQVIRMSVTPDARSLLSTFEFSQ